LEVIIVPEIEGGPENVEEGEKMGSRVPMKDLSEIR